MIEQTYLNSDETVAQITADIKAGAIQKKIDPTPRISSELQHRKQAVVDFEKWLEIDQRE